MKAVIQRVSKASVEIHGELYSTINKGIVVLFCVEKNDNLDNIHWLCKKLISLRLFEDENGKMNKSVIDVKGEILVISQFTLAADCKKGTRPSFDNAEHPVKAQQMYNKFVELLSNSDVPVKTGVFGADMAVYLCNDGPVTFVLEQ